MIFEKFGCVAYSEFRIGPGCDELIKMAPPSFSGFPPRFTGFETVSELKLNFDKGLGGV